MTHKNSKNNDSQPLVPTGLEPPRRVPSPEEVAIKRDPKVRVLFRNVLDPGVTLSMSYGGVSFDLEDGKAYDLPVCVVNHLNSIKQPNIRYDPNSPSGNQNITQGFLYRFSCQMVDGPEKIKIA